MVILLGLMFVGANVASGASVSHRSAAPIPAPAVCSDDQAVLGAATCSRITQLLAADEQQTTEEIAVLVIGSTGAQSIESYSTQVFNSWGIGKQGLDNGVLVVVAFDDRALRIEVGTGLAGRLPDGQAREIVGGTMLPAFKSGDYRYGVLAGVDAVRVALGHPVDNLNRMTAIPEDVGYDDPTPAQQYVPPTYSSSQSDTGDSNRAIWVIAIVIVGAIALVAWLHSISGGGGSGGSSATGYSRRTYRSFSSRSSSSRSSGSPRRSGFGGGRSSGGGASGRW